MRLLPAAPLLLAVLLLAGCATPLDPPGGGPAPGAGTPSDATSSPTPTDSPSPAPRHPTMDIHGVVVDAAIHPIGGAQVSLLAFNQTRTTDAGGRFAFEGLRPGAYVLTASAPGHRDRTLSTDASRARETLQFVLDSLPPTQPYNVTIHYRGILQCAFEALILSPSCDSALTFAGAPPLFDQNSSFPLFVQEGWRTVVAQVVFDPGSQPALDGLRVSVRGSFDADAGGQYEQYGRFFGADPFTFRIEPNGTYDDGVAPVPSNTTRFLFDVYPQSLAWHAACAPNDDPCFLGVGAGVDVSFDLYLTTFYAAAAPADFQPVS